MKVSTPRDASSGTLFEKSSIFMELRTRIQGMTIETQLKRRRTRNFKASETKKDKTSKDSRPIR